MTRGRHSSFTGRNRSTYRRLECRLAHERCDLIAVFRVEGGILGIAQLGEGDGRRVSFEQLVHESRSSSHDGYRYGTEAETMMQHDNIYPGGSPIRIGNER